MDVVMALYNNGTNCDGWDDGHLLGGWLFKEGRVPMSSVPRQGRARRNEITRRHDLLPPDLLADPAYNLESTFCNTYTKIDRDPQRRARYLNEDEFEYDPPLAAEVKKEAHEELSLPERDDTTDCLRYLAYLVEETKEEEMEDHLLVMPEGVHEEEALSLAMKACEL
jgi:hypothetical protein